MRLIFPAMLALLGCLCGLLIQRQVPRSTLAPHISGLIGVVGAFVGLLLRDVSDIHIGNDTLATFVAAVLGAVLLSLVANLMSRGR